MRNITYYCKELGFNAKILIEILDKKEKEIKKENQVLIEIKKIDDSKTSIKDEKKYNEIKTSNISIYENILS